MANSLRHTHNIRRSACTIAFFAEEVTLAAEAEVRVEAVGDKAAAPSLGQVPVATAYAQTAAKRSRTKPASGALT
jgi:hypothetical protein